MPPTVALVSHRLARPLAERTGLGRYQQALVTALADHGAHAPVLVALDEGPDALPDWVPVPVVRLRGPRGPLQVAWTLTGLPPLERLLPGDQAVDLVHVLDATVAASSRAPLVHTVHDLFPLTHPRWETPRGRLLFRGVARTVRRADRVITPSRAVADQVVRHLGVGAERVVVVPEGVDDRFRAAAPRVPAALHDRGVEPDGYWLAVGRPGPRKNLAVLVDALAGADTRRPLVIAGPPGPASRALADRAAERGVRVHLLGFVPDEELPGLVAGARALLHPAHDEGFGLPPLEAMAAGVPAVVAPSPAVLEVVGPDARTCPATDVAAWRGAIDHLDRDDDARAQLGAAGRARAAAFTWETTARLTSEVYDACLP